MNTKKLEIKIEKLALQPGDLVLVTLPDVTRRLHDEIGASIRGIVGPQHQVVIFREGITVERLTLDMAVDLIRAQPFTFRAALGRYEGELVEKTTGLPAHRDKND
jgi:hypothetical protein